MTRYFPSIQAQMTNMDPQPVLLKPVQVRKPGAFELERIFFEAHLPVFAQGGTGETPEEALFNAIHQKKVGSEYSNVILSSGPSALLVRVEFTGTDDHAAIIRALARASEFDSTRIIPCVQCKKCDLYVNGTAVDGELSFDHNCGKEEEE